MKLFGKSSVTLHGPVLVLVDLCTFRQACSILAVCILYFLFGEKNEEKKQSRDQIENSDREDITGFVGAGSKSVNQCEERGSGRMAPTSLNS